MLKPIHRSPLRRRRNLRLVLAVAAVLLITALLSMPALLL